MLQKINRLKKRKEYSYIYKKGEIVFAPSFTIHYVRAFKRYPQIGISVSKTVGNSVIRSRVKRIISEACRLNITHFAVKNYVITAKPEIVTKKSTDIEKELIIALKKAKLYQENQQPNVENNGSIKSNLLQTNLKHKCTDATKMRTKKDNFYAKRVKAETNCKIKERKVQNVSSGEENV